MTTPRPVVEATNRLAGFNAERDQILAIVHRRIVDAYISAAAQSGDSSLEYILNEVAFSEMRRLEKSPSRESQKQFQRWRELANRLLHMNEETKRAELEDLTSYYCRDIVGNFNPRVFRFASGVLPPALSLLLSPKRSWREGVAALTEVGKQVQVEGPLDVIRAVCERGTLVFTPTHSSNMDSIVIGLALVLAKLPPVTYGAGKNLFTNPFISYFMRNLGAYRVDRRLGFRLYKDILKEYSTVLLERGYHSLFFPGGTRCRSNMIEQRLKLGLLGSALRAYLHNVRQGMPERRVYIVPVTINYRLVLEAETLIDDYLAETGRSRYIIQDDEFSRLDRILEFARKILVHEGAVLIRYGNPLDPFGNEVDSIGESRDRRGRRIDPASYLTGANGQVAIDDQRDAEYTRLVGNAVARSFRAGTVYLSTCLVSRALMDQIAQAAGTRDIYRLLRLEGEALRASTAAVARGVERLRERIGSDPEVGLVHSPLAKLPGDAIIRDALRSLASYHTHPVAMLAGEVMEVGSMKLLYYYQNRLSHLPVEAVA